MAAPPAPSPVITPPRLDLVPLLRQAIADGYDSAPAQSARRISDDAKLLLLLTDPPAFGRLPGGQRVVRPRETCWWLVDDVTFYGNVTLRHELTAETERQSGHIGYGVHPGYRNRGHATRLLRHGLDEARKIGLTRALLTIDADNLASIRVAEKCGAWLWDVIDHPYKPGTPHARYWIEL